MRVRKKLAQKCGKKSTDRTKNIIHVVTKAIIDTGKTPVLEDLEGITKLYNKKNKRGKNANFKGKSWSCSEYANQINYKTLQQGDMVIFIDPSSTSSKCAVCGERLIAEERKMMRCPNGYASMDRDKHAAVHILCRGIKGLEAGLDGNADEAMKMLRHGRNSLVEVVSVDAFQESRIPDSGVEFG